MLLDTATGENHGGTIWYAFYFADKYAPEHVKFYYNDYNEQFKTQHVVNWQKPWLMKTEDH